jgi:hypothetical protein
MRASILLFVFCLLSNLLLAQSRTKDDYAILEAVLRKESAIGLSRQVNNIGMIKSTDSLRQFTGAIKGKRDAVDSVFQWDEAARSEYFSQINAAAQAQWDKQRVYFCPVLDQDAISDLDQGKNKDEILKKNKTHQIWRIGQPLYRGESAMVYVEFQMMGVLNGNINFRNSRHGFYFLTLQKGRWKISRYIGQSSSK